MFRFLKFLGWYIGISVAVGLGFLITDFSNHPKTLSGWIWLFVLALPLTIVAQLIGNLISDSLFENRFAKHIETKTADQEFSWLRIGYGLLSIILTIVLIGAAWWLAHRFGFVANGNVSA